MINFVLGYFCGFATLAVPIALVWWAVGVENQRELERANDWQRNHPL